ncbi:hypothetical protein GCM10009841_33120 [Microlunatus panaciterrae]|uniref:DUF202 domain-containing protein n=1 Tax=Microlunatus panaciterrae TaxID=400768 RepID=A0ABS2RG40_9ACTN|nr:hypothetical protein [Microlunatus panaciterrae]MBM7797970.1 hypothetical protein [Microlunatus panaciterrae]
MFAEPESVKTDTIFTRLARYDHYLRRCAYVGGGLGGLLVLLGLSGNAINNAPGWLRATLITIVVVSAATLGRSYLGFASAHYDLTVRQKTDGLEDKTTADPVLPYENSSHIFYVTSAALLIVAAALVIVGAWWAP